MRVLGIDPGLRRLGWGIIDAEGSRLRHVANGVCESEGGDDLATRLLALHRQLTEVLTRFAPEIAAVEQTFVNKDAVGTLKLGQARGVALLDFERLRFRKGLGLPQGRENGLHCEWAVFTDALGDLAVIENLCAALGDTPVAICHIGIAHELTDGKRFTARRTISSPRKRRSSG